MTPVLRGTEVRGRRRVAVTRLGRCVVTLLLGLALIVVQAPGVECGAWDMLVPLELDLLRSESSSELLISGSNGRWLYPCGTCEAGWDQDDLDEVMDDSEQPASSKPPPPGFVSILIDVDRVTLTVYSDEQVWHTFTVAVGKADTPTALGEWHIVSRAIWGGAFGSRWLGLSIPWATYGIHGTNRPSSIGSRASHGCVRMRNRDIETLYRWVKVGTPVKVIGRPRAHFGEVPRNMVRTHIGSDVLQLQLALRELGLYLGPLDGRFGWGTDRAVREFQWIQFIKVTGVVDVNTRKALGLP